MSIRPVQGTTDIIQPGDNNNVVAYFSSSPVTVTVPAGLMFTFRTTILQVGSGLVTLTAGTGVSLVSESGSLASLGQNGEMLVTGFSTNEFVLAQVGGSGSGNPGGATNSTQYNAGGGNFGGVAPGTSGQVLTSNGSGSAPTFQSLAAGVPLTVIGNGGTVANTGTIDFGSGATVSGTTPTAAVSIAGGSSLLQSASVSLTSAQILASNVTQVPVVSAPGSGKAVIVVTSMYEYTFGSVAYSGDGGRLLYNGSFNQSEAAADIGDNDSLIGTSSSLTINGNGVSPFLSNAENSQVAYGVPSTNVPWTLGDGTLKITVLYYVLTL